MEPTYFTYFKLEDGSPLGNVDGIIPIPLYQGMTITIHGHEGEFFEVVDWNYHHGHPDENTGLRIILRKKNPDRTGE